MYVCIYVCVRMYALLLLGKDFSRTFFFNRNTDSAGSLSVPLTLTWGSNNTQQCSQINYLEHVLVEVNLTYTRRGDLEMELESAQRTTSTLLSHRPMDTVSRNTELRGWRVKSLHFWGENPSGIWTLKMRNAVPRQRRNSGMLKSETNSW